MGDYHHALDARCRPKRVLVTVARVSGASARERFGVGRASAGAPRAQRFPGRITSLSLVPRQPVYASRLRPAFTTCHQLQCATMLSSRNAPRRRVLHSTSALVSWIRYLAESAIGLPLHRSTHRTVQKMTSPHIVAYAERIHGTPESGLREKVETLRERQCDCSSRPRGSMARVSVKGLVDTAVDHSEAARLVEGLVHPLGPWPRADVKVLQ